MPGSVRPCWTASRIGPTFWKPARNRTDSGGRPKNAIGRRKRRKAKQKPSPTYNVPRWANLNRRNGPKEVAKRITASHVANGVQGNPSELGIQQIIQILAARGIQATSIIAVSIPNVETSHI